MRKLAVNAKTRNGFDTDRPSGLTPFHMIAYTQAPTTILEGREIRVEKIEEFEDKLSTMITELRKHIGDINVVSECDGWSPLHLAAYHNAATAVRVLIKHGCQLNAVTKENRTSFMIACMRNAQDVINVFLEHREKLNMEIVDRNGSTYLHLMAQYCSEDGILDFLDINKILGQKLSQYVPRIVKMQKLLNKTTTSPLLTHDKKMTPLRIAAERGLLRVFPKMREILCWKLTDWNNQVSDIEQRRCAAVIKDTLSINREILHDAVANGNGLGIVRELIEFGFSVEQENDFGQIPLHIAAKYNNVDIVEELLNEHLEEHRTGQIGSENRSANIRLMFTKMSLEMQQKSIAKRDSKGMTPLLYTACTGAWEAAEALILCMQEVEATKLYFDKNFDGETLIIIAARNNHSHYLDKLIENMKEKRILNQPFLSKASVKRTTALHSVVEHGSLTATMRLMREKVRMDLLNGDNQTALHVATKAGHLHVVEHLMRIPSIVSIINHKDSRSETPLHIAAHLGFDQIVQILLRRGADPTIHNIDRETPFIMAVANGHLECVNILLPEDISGENEQLPPLHYGAKNGHANVVQFLLRQGAKVDIRDKCDPSRTALTVALDAGHESVGRELLSMKNKNWKNLLFDDKQRQQGSVETYNTPMRQLIRDFPDLADLVMTQCISEKDGVSTYDFQFIDDPFLMLVDGRNDDLQATTKSSNGESIRAIMEDGKVRSDARVYSGKGSQIYDDHPIMIMAKSKKEETKKLLAHPLVMKFVDYRWSEFGVFFSFWLSILPYFLFLLSFMFILLLDGEDAAVKESSQEFTTKLKFVLGKGFTLIEDSHLTNSTISNNITGVEINATDSLLANITQFEEINSTGNHKLFVFFSFLLERLRTFLHFQWGWIFFGGAMLVFLLVKEVIQACCFGFCAYIKSGENQFEILVYVLCPVIIVLKAFIDNNLNEIFSQIFWICASVVVVLASINLLMLISTSSTFGIFLRMIEKVSSTVFNLTPMFFFFIAAFSSSFILLLRDEKGFGNFSYSFLTTLVMSTGEMNYLEIFQMDETNDKLLLKIGAGLLLIFFIGVMVIMAMNLITGLAVDDIQGIQKLAEIEGIAIEADFVLHAQAFLSENVLKRLKYKLVEETPGEERKGIIQWVIRRLIQLKLLFTSLGFACTLFQTFCGSCSDRNTQLIPSVPRDPDDGPPSEKKCKMTRSNIDEKFAQESLAALSTEKLLSLNQISIRSLQKEVKNLYAKVKDPDELQESFASTENELKALQNDVKQLNTKMESQEEALKQVMVLLKEILSKTASGQSGSSASAEAEQPRSIDDSIKTKLTMGDTGQLAAMREQRVGCDDETAESTQSEETKVNEEDFSKIKPPGTDLLVENDESQERRA